MCDPACPKASMASGLFGARLGRLRGAVGFSDWLMPLAGRLRIRPAIHVGVSMHPAVYGKNDRGVVGRRFFCFHNGLLRGMGNT